MQKNLLSLVFVVCCGLLAGCGGGQQQSTVVSVPSLASVSVVNQVPLDGSLYGHNMAVSGCTAYVTMQNNLALSKLAVVNLCGAGTVASAAPVLVSKTAGSYAAMNGIAVNGPYLYVTYDWATNPFEVWSAGTNLSPPALLSCLPLFSDNGYTTCAAAASGYGALLGSNPTVIGSDVYVAENSDDKGQAVQVLSVANPALPVRQAYPAGITAGVSTGGSTLAGLWAVGSGSTLYVGTVDGSSASDQPVTITAYSAATNALTPAQLGVPLNIPAGYFIQSMAVQGTTVVATLTDSAIASSKILVASFSNPAAPTMAMIAPTAGCVFESQNFIAVQNGYAFVGCGMSPGIEVVQFSTASAPVLVGQAGATLTGVNFLALEGSYLYAVDLEGNLDTLLVGTTFQ